MVRQMHGDIQSDDEPGYRTKIGDRESSYRCAGSVTLHWIIQTRFPKYNARSLENNPNRTKLLAQRQPERRLAARERVLTSLAEYRRRERLDFASMFCTTARWVRKPGMERGDVPSNLLKTKGEREKKPSAAQGQQTEIEHRRGLKGEQEKRKE